MTDLFDLRAGAATIVIDDGRYAGVEVVVQLDAPYRVKREARRLVEELAQAEDGSDEQAAAVDALYGLMTGDPEDAYPDPIVLAWNLAIGGQPVPVSVAGMHRASLSLAMTILGTWRRYVGMVMPPLPSSSPSTSEPEPTTSSDWSDGASATSADPPTDTPSIP